MSDLRPKRTSRSLADLTIFSLAYLAMPVFLFFVVVAFLWKRKMPRKASEIDLDVSSSAIATALLGADYSSTDGSQVMVDRGGDEAVESGASHGSLARAHLSYPVLELE